MNLLTWSYWFSLSSEPFLPWAAKTVFFALTIFLVAGFLSWYVGKNHPDRFLRGVFRRVSKLFLTLSLFGFVFFFFIQEAIPFFGARFWYLIIFFGGIFWAAMIFRKYKKSVPLQRQHASERAQYEKYLP